MVGESLSLDFEAVRMATLSGTWKSLKPATASKSTETVLPVGWKW